MSKLDDRVLRAVESSGTPYEVIEIDPAYADTAAFCERYGYPPEQSANTIVVASKKTPRKFAACVVLAVDRLDVNRRVRRLMGVSRASFATSAEMAERTGMEVGGVTPFALPDDMPVYIDERIMRHDWVIVGAGGRGAKLKVSPGALAALANAEVVAGLSLARAGE